MKKFLTALCTSLLVVILAIGLAGCSKADKIKSAYEEAGYKVVTATVKDNNEAKSALKALGLTDDDLKEAENWEVISATKVSLSDGGTALVLKFPSSGDVKNFLTIEKDDGSKDTTAYDKSVENGNVNGDCLLLIGVGGAKDIFKNA